MKKDNNFVPENAEQMWNHYFAGSDSIANQVLRTMMPYASSEEREDLLQTAVVRAIEHNIIGKFDRTKGNFGGLVYVCVRSAVSNHLGKKERGPIDGLSKGSIVETDDEFEFGQFQLGRMFAVDTRIDEALDASEKLGSLFSYCKDCLRRNGHKRDRSLLPLLEMLAEGLAPKDCAEKLGVTLSTVHNWMGHMKEVA